MKSHALAALLSLAGTQGFAEVTVQFIEGAPKDRFVITNGACPTGPLKLTVDLRPSAGALIFDVTGAGAGVEVFQPFELVSGGSLVATAPSVQDGDQLLSLELAELAQGAVVAFTIDLDDTIQSREITVAGSELTGAQIMLESSAISAVGTFDASAMVTLPWSECTS